MPNIVIPTVEQMRDQYLDDIYLAAIDAGVSDPPIEQGSDWYAHGSALANLLTIPCEQIRAADSDWDPRTCSAERLEQWRQSLGLPVVSPAGARGKVIVRLDASSGTVTDGTVLFKSGLQYRISGSWVGVVDGSEISCEAIDTGIVTDQKAGARLDWASAPPGFKSYVEVSTNEPLSGATDQETTEQLRERVTDRIQNPPAAGNWSSVREAVTNIMPTVEPYVYPALGGPSSCKVVLVKDIDIANRSFSRVPTASQLTQARQAIWSNVADGTKFVVQAVAQESTSVALSLEIPDATTSGGTGKGWVNDAPWPSLVGADSGRVSVTAVTSSKVFTVGANTTTAPVNNQTYIDWWSPGDQKFHRAQVVSSSGSAGAWVLTINTPFVDEDNTLISVGDYISPAAVASSDYGDTWRDIMAALGPGENTASATTDPRRARHPAIDSQDSPDLTSSQRKAFMNAHPEIIDCEYGYRSTSSATVPGAVSAAPNVLVLDNFGIYPE